MNFDQAPRRLGRTDTVDLRIGHTIRRRGLLETAKLRRFHQDDDG